VIRANEGSTPSRHLMKFYKFQEIDLGYLADVMREHGGAYLGWDRGCGKTLGAIAIADELAARRVLVVAPNTAKSTVWEPAVRQFLPDYAVAVLPNSKPKRERMLAQIKNDKGPIVLIVHYEALHLIAKTRSDGRGWDRYGTWDLVIADEAHRIKNPSTKMARSLKKVPARFKLALSGSIIQNHADELFSPLQWLFPDRYKSKWRDWNDRYLDYVDSGFARVPVGVKLNRLDDMRAELGVFMAYRRKEDELDLPKRTDQTLYVELSNEQRRVYDDLEVWCLAQIDEWKTVKAADGIALFGKLRQVATGIDLVAENIADSTKMDVALELITDNPDEQTVVFSWYKLSGRAMADRLAQAGIKAAVIDGDVKHEDRATRIEAFTRGEYQVLCGTISTMGESVNLQNASSAIFLDRSWNPAQNQQAEDRIYRIGQKNPVTITHLVARDTVDQTRVSPVLNTKDALRRLILGA
jgi:SNF2 family DNA or RNA helicase